MKTLRPVGFIGAFLFKKNMAKIDYEKRRSKAKKYMIFIDELKTSPHGFENMEIGRHFKMENGATYTVCKIQKDEYMNIEFSYLKINPFY